MSTKKSSSVAELVEKTRSPGRGGARAYLDQPQNAAALQELREYVKACHTERIVPSGVVIMPHLREKFGLKLADSALRFRLRQELAALED